MRFLAIQLLLFSHAHFFTHTFFHTHIFSHTVKFHYSEIEEYCLTLHRILTILPQGYRNGLLLILSLSGKSLYRYLYLFSCLIAGKKAGKFFQTVYRLPVKLCNDILFLQSGIIRSLSC